MATINLPSTETNVSIPSVSFAQGDTTGGFLGGLVKGALESAPDIMAARKEKMKLQAAQTSESNLQLAIMDAEDEAANIASLLEQGRLTSSQAKVQFALAQNKAARARGVASTDLSKLRESTNPIINSLVEEKMINPLESQITINTFTNKVVQVGPKPKVQDQVASVLAQLEQSPYKNYWLDKMQKDPEKTTQEWIELGRLQDEFKALDREYQIKRLGREERKASKEETDKELNQNKTNLQWKLRDTVRGIANKYAKMSAGGLDPKLAESQALAEIDAVITSNPSARSIAVELGLDPSTFFKETIGDSIANIKTTIEGGSAIQGMLYDKQYKDTMIDITTSDWMLSLPKETQAAVKSGTSLGNLAFSMKTLQFMADTDPMSARILQSFNAGNFKQYQTSSANYSQLINKMKTNDTDENLVGTLKELTPVLDTLQKALAGSKDINAMDFATTDNVTAFNALETAINSASFKKLSEEEPGIAMKYTNAYNALKVKMPTTTRK